MTKCFMSRPSRLGKEDILSRQKGLMSRQSWPGWEFSVVTECFYVTIELAMVERLNVAT